MKALITKHALIFYIMLMSLSCSTKKSEVVRNDATDDNVERDDFRLKHYVIEGRRLYQQHCSNCHQEDGSGLGRLIPPLNSTDYLDDNVLKMACIIRNGIKGEIIVNGENYNQPMPGHPDLTNLEIAEIITYVANEWTDQKKLVPVKSIEGLLDNCDQETSTE